MAYTPVLSYKHSCTLRRIAWALDVPMTKAMGMIFDYICKVIEGSKICESCRDKTRCKDCMFNCAKNLHICSTTDFAGKPCDGF
jgi:hypothetical protein